MDNKSYVGNENITKYSKASTVNGSDEVSNDQTKNSSEYYTTGSLLKPVPAKDRRLDKESHAKSDMISSMKKVDDTYYTTGIELKAGTAKDRRLDKESHAKSETNSSMKKIDDNSYNLRVNTENETQKNLSDLSTEYEAISYHNPAEDTAHDSVRYFAKQQNIRLPIQNNLQTNIQNTVKNNMEMNNSLTTISNNSNFNINPPLPTRTQTKDESTRKLSIRINNKRLLIGLAVGVVLILIIVVVAVAVLASKKEKPEDSGQSENLESKQCSNETWSDWTVCSKTCGQGTQFRVKGCIDSNSLGYGNTETRLCSVTECTETEPNVCSWSAWTNCSVSCGDGIQWRVQTCTGKKTNTLSDIRICSDSSCLGPAFENLELKFDRYMGHDSCYVSYDNRMASNYYSSETQISAGGAWDEFQYYRGLPGNTCFQSGLIVYYEFSYEYEIFSSLEERLLVLDFGVGEINWIDSYHHLSDGIGDEWSFSIYGCMYSSYKICIGASNWDDNYISDETFSDNSAGSIKSGTFGILLNRKRGELSLIDIFKQEVFYTFNFVMSDHDLCPVFGVGYNSHSLHASVKILRSYFLFRSPDRLPEVTFNTINILKTLIDETN